MTAPRIYFAGVNQLSWCDWFAGHHVLESFANVRPLMDRYRPTFKSMALDSGAYTEMTSGKPIDLGAYAEFCQQHAQFYEFVASLDSITGGVDVNLRNLALLQDRGVEAVPTFHQGEPFSVLQDYCRDFKRIGLGFQRPIVKPREWLGECFDIIPADVQVHGWGMTAYTDLPFWSVDSRTWLFEVQALLGVEGQGAAALNCLTQRELLEIVVKKYERQPARVKWQGKRKTVQMGLSLDLEDAAVKA